MSSGPIACLDLPAFPLQLVWRAQPSWRELPVVVVDEDRPQGFVQWACERARASGVLPGMRYAHALSTCAGLRASTMPEDRVAAAIVELRTALHALSPRVEPADAPGTFWLDGEGLQRIFDLPAAAGAAAPTAVSAPSAVAVAGAAGSNDRSWARLIHRCARELGYAAAVVVGGSRFATYAIARARGVGVHVIARMEDERRAARQVPLDRLEVAPRTREALARLGVGTVGELIALPGGGVLERFGREAFHLHQVAAGACWDPVVAMPTPERLDERVLLDDEDDDVDRLVFAVRAPLGRLLERLAARARALTVLHVELTLKHAVGQLSTRTDDLQPAQPTLDDRLLVRLLLLRLTGSPLVAPVSEIRVWADDIPATGEQLGLFHQRPRRDLGKIEEVVAAVRAELGDDAVVRAVLRDGHLPESTFGWERLTHVAPASPRRVAMPPLVRRILRHPLLLPPQPRQVRNDGWILRGLAQGSVVQLIGPYVISGGWWGREQPVHREYHYVQLQRGDLLWIYYDRARQRWFQQGTVE